MLNTITILERVNWDKMIGATQETIYMTIISAIFTFIIGLLLGILLFLTSKDNLWENKVFNKILDALINIFRSIPFIILLILIIPFTKALIGTIFGANAALPALIIGTSPFYARMVVIGLREVDKGVLEAAKAMGASTTTIILKVLIPESLPALISGITVTTVSLVGFTTMAGLIGAGGLGNLAYLEGFQRTNGQVTFVATVIILIIVFIIQSIGDFIVKSIDKR